MTKSALLLKHFCLTSTFLIGISIVNHFFPTQWYTSASSHTINIHYYPLSTYNHQQIIEVSEIIQKEKEYT